MLEVLETIDLYANYLLMDLRNPYEVRWEIEVNRQVALEIDYLTAYKKKKKKLLDLKKKKKKNLTVILAKLIPAKYG